MKKTILLFTGICLISTKFVMAEGFAFHGGLGYHSSFSGASIRADNEWRSSNFGEKSILVLKNMPHGLSLLVGLGYAFGSEKKITVGSEGVLGSAISLNPPEANNLFLQGRAFAKYTPSEKFSVTGFAGVKSHLALSKWAMPSGAYPVFGVRIEPLVFYLEYGVVLRGNFSNVYSHDIAIGLMFS